MNRRIQSYKDLLSEKERLQSLLNVQKEIVHRDLREIKEELEPVRSAISFAGKLISRDNSNVLLNAGVNKLIDLLVKKVFLSRAGWIMRQIVPFFLKNYSSHIISENKDAIFSKIFSWIKKSNNGHEKAYSE